MPNRFQACRALDGSLARLLPVTDGLRRGPASVDGCASTSGCTAQISGKRLAPGQCAEVLLAGALEQRLIGRVLDQGVLEEVRRLGWQPLLIQELRLDQLLQPTP